MPCHITTGEGVSYTLGNTALTCLAHELGGDFTADTLDASVKNYIIQRIVTKKEKLFSVPREHL